MPSNGSTVGSAPRASGSVRGSRVSAADLHAVRAEVHRRHRVGDTVGSADCARPRCPRASTECDDAQVRAERDRLQTAAGDEIRRGDARALAARVRDRAKHRLNWAPGSPLVRTPALLPNRKPGRSESEIDRVRHRGRRRIEPGRRGRGPVTGEMHHQRSGSGRHDANERHVQPRTAGIDRRPRRPRGGDCVAVIWNTPAIKPQLLLIDHAHGQIVSLPHGPARGIPHRDRPRSRGRAAGPTRAHSPWLGLATLGRDRSAHPAPPEIPARLPGRRSARFDARLSRRPRAGPLRSSRRPLKALGCARIAVRNAARPMLRR